MRTNIVDLRRLRAFQMVARHGSLQSAASRLHVTTSAISVQLKTLEGDLGVRLFQRVGRRLVLTPPAALFLIDVENILVEVDRALNSVKGKPAARSHISLAIGADLTRYFSTAIADFIKHNPEVELSFRLRHSPDTLSRLLNGEVDMAVGHFGVLPPEVIKRPLLRTGFSAVFPSNHPLSGLRRPHLRDIGAHCLIIPRQDSDMGQRIMRSFVEAGATPKSVIEAGNCQSSRDLAEQGIGVAIVHSACLEQHHSATLRTTDVSRIFGEVGIVMAYRKSFRLTSAHLELLKRMEAVGVKPSSRSHGKRQN